MTVLQGFLCLPVCQSMTENINRFRRSSTVNRMVAGSNPARGAKDFNSLSEIARSDEIACACAVSANQLPRAACIGLRPAVAFPIYTVSLILSFLSNALGCLAARIAGDDWPR
jgi:hypothetical protein